MYRDDAFTETQKEREQKKALAQMVAEHKEKQVKNNVIEK